MPFLHGSDSATNPHIESQAKYLSFRFTVDIVLIMPMVLCMCCRPSGSSYTSPPYAQNNTQSLTISTLPKQGKFCQSNTRLCLVDVDLRFTFTNSPLNVVEGEWAGD